MTTQYYSYGDTCSGTSYECDSSLNLVCSTGYNPYSNGPYTLGASVCDCKYLIFFKLLKNGLNFFFDFKVQ